MDLHPLKFLFPDLSRVQFSTAFFESLREAFPQHHAANLFFQRPEAMYVYRIQTRQRSHTGLLCCTDILNYIEGQINVHELTLSIREETQIDLILKRGAAVKPVLMTYPNIRQLDTLLYSVINNHPPFREMKFEEEDQLHSFWEITDPEKWAEIASVFKPLAHKIVIADGHHRSEAQAILYQRLADQGDLKNPFRYLLSAIFAADELDIWSFNRVVELPHGTTPAQFVQNLHPVFNLTPAAPEPPVQKGEMILFADDSCYRARWRPEVLHRLARSNHTLLDAGLLNELIFTDFLGIRDVRNDARIQYIEGVKGLEGLEKSLKKNPNSIGFWLYPVHIDDLMTLAADDKSLPPKSTWFEPRMKNGMIVQLF